jgi:voltage-gated potassium channel
MKDYFNKGKVKSRPVNFTPLREKLHDIIFESDTWQGRVYDMVLLGMILCSILVLLLETVPAYFSEYAPQFAALEWFFTVYFTLEYALRIYTVYKPKVYLLSFYGVVDLLSLLPSYLGLLVPGTHSLMAIRALRLIRIFRIFKMDGFVDQGNRILNAIADSREKLIVFGTSILIVVTVAGSVMYVAENGVNPDFDSIPRCMYWAIVTITTVGYGDISPVTTLGQLIASLMMLLGYIILAVPTGIVTSHMMSEKKQDASMATCAHCGVASHREEAAYCYACGNGL